jgi:uncharacterized protein YdhG (YjbR/CyaY superfamily)
MGNDKAKEVDSYIAASAAEARPTLDELRKVIRSTVPKADEGISWGVPFYKYHGLLAGFAVFKNHATFALAFTLSSEDRKKLEEKGYTTGKKSIQIKFGQKVPTAAIKQILQAKAKMNEAKKRLTRNK